MEYVIEYDRTDPRSIEQYAKRLIGKTFREIIEDDDRKNEIGVSFDSFEDKTNKGNLGQIIEERFFHYDCNSDSRADFYEAGVELKVTPYKTNKNGTLSAKERLILTMIDYHKVVTESFEESHLWNKSKLILLVYYHFMKDIRFNLDYRIGYSSLFSPPEQDVRIIRHDYYMIVSKIKEGKAHELSEADTLYLGAAPKAASSKSRRSQPFSDTPAKPRAFAFKTSYMTYVLNYYVTTGKNTYETIIKGEPVESFEDYVIKKIKAYQGYSIDELCEVFDVENRKVKNLEAILTYRILGIKGNHAEEFEKASVVVKTIRIGQNDRIKESMSFPTFRFKELIEESWDDSTFGNYLRQTRFFFVVFRADKTNAWRLRGCQFWNIPYKDLESDVKSVWHKTQKVIRDGLQVEIINGVRSSNLPKASENPICHVRPHAKNAEDTYELPDGRNYPKQCFWLNNTYIYNQLDDDIKG